MAEAKRRDIDDLELLRSAAVAAGIIAAGFFRRNPKTWTKQNASPVSEADIALDNYLKQMLMGDRPEYGWLSEETVVDPARLETTRTFVVDPIDGTRAFIRGEDYWSISLAIVENGETVAGVIYAPTLDQLYAANRNGGAFLNGEPLKRVSHPGSTPIIPAPGAVHQELQAEGLAYVRGPAYSSLAYRLVQVATGRIDAAVARRGAQDWDIAAAALILSECGITLEDVCAFPLRFNKPEIRHGALAAAADESLKPLLHAALRRVYGCPPDMSETTDLEHQTQ